MTTITHKNHTADYWAGHAAKMFEIAGMGVNAAQEKFNLDYPIGYNNLSMGAYYYAKGELDALVESTE